MSLLGGTRGKRSLERIKKMPVPKKLTVLMLNQARTEGAEAMVFGAPPDDGLPRRSMVDQLATVSDTPSQEDAVTEADVEKVLDIFAGDDQLPRRVLSGPFRAMPIWYCAKGEWREVQPMTGRLVLDVLICIREMLSDPLRKGQEYVISFPGTDNKDYNVLAELTIEDNCCFAVRFRGPFETSK